MVTILDSHNLFHTIGAKYGKDKKLDYGKIFRQRSIVVGFDALAFENYLRQVGYEVYMVPPPSDNAYGTAMLMAQAFRINTEYIRLGTQDKNIIPLVEVLKGKGIYVEVMGCGIPKELRIASNKWTEIQEDILCTIASK